MPPASQSFIIDSIHPDLSICLMILFKGYLSTCVDHSSELLTLHAGHTLSLSQNHMKLQSYCAPWSYFPHWQVTLKLAIDISLLVTDQVVSLVFDDKKSIHRLGFVQCVGFHQTLLVESSHLLVVFIIGCYSKGLFHVLLAFNACKRHT